MTLATRVTAAMTAIAPTLHAAVGNWASAYRDHVDLVRKERKAKNAGVDLGRSADVRGRQR